jgi:two-component system response regulator MprA
LSARILIIDDDEKITALLRRGLTFEGYLVQTASSGSAGIEAVHKDPPDLIILDIMLPGIDGFEVCRQLRILGNLPILMLTARDEVIDRVKGLDTGADDYLVKPFAFSELLARIRALLRRRRNDHAILIFADLHLDTGSREARRWERSIELTTKEYALLLLFMQNPRQVLTRELIMEKIWGFDYSGESNVLEVYIGYLRQKLEAAGEKRLIQTVRGVGYVLKE